MADFKKGDRVLVKAGDGEPIMGAFDNPLTGEKTEGVVGHKWPVGVITDGPLNDEVDDIIADGVFWMVDVEGDPFPAVPIDQTLLAHEDEE